MISPSTAPAPPAHNAPVRVERAAAAHPSGCHACAAARKVPQAVRIAVDGRAVLALTADARGRLAFVLYFWPGVPARSYTISAASQATAANAAQTHVAIDQAAQLLARPGGPALPQASALPAMFVPIASKAVV